MSTTTLTRGDTYAGGEYVGTTPGGSEWVARKPGEFAALCARLDTLWEKYGRQTVAVKVTRTMRESVLDALDNDKANGHDVGTIIARRDWLRMTRHACLLAAEDLQREADDIEGFADLTDEEEKLTDGLRDHLTAQRLKARKRWIARLMRGAGSLVREGK